MCVSEYTVVVHALITVINKFKLNLFLETINVTNLLFFETLITRVSIRIVDSCNFYQA